MIYKNIEIHNAAELYDTGGGSVSWKRVPSSVHNVLESKNPDNEVHPNIYGVQRIADVLTEKIRAVPDNHKL